ncbi:hypothetical protein DL98DRAFT_523057 [Cadophora sp. DSE1049]|nr:hypothetical protein DL98DRAFT_523057 [Cadophora sp. DSE1049]
MAAQGFNQPNSDLAAITVSRSGKSSTTTISRSYSPAQMAEEQQLPQTKHDLHLSRNSVDVGALAEVRKFLATAALNKPVEGVQRCKDEGLPKACGGLITALGFKDKIKGMKYNVVRIHGACSPRIELESTADLIPIQVWGEDPTVEGMALAPGSVTHITKEVKVMVQRDSILDLLYLVEKLVEA